MMAFREAEVVKFDLEAVYRLPLTTGIEWEDYWYCT